MATDDGLLTRSRARTKRPLTEEMEGINADVQDVINSNPAAAKFFGTVPVPPKKKKKSAASKPKAKPVSKSAAKPASKDSKKKKKALSSASAESIQRIEHPVDAAEPVAGPSNHDHIEIDISSDDDLLPDTLLPPKETPIRFRFKQENPSQHRKTTTLAARSPSPNTETLLSTFHLRWKYAKPVNDPKKALRMDDGYKAMIISLDERTKDLTVEVHMPPPLFLATDLPCETDNYQPADRFEELDVPVPTSVRQQMATLDTSAAPIIEQLNDKYPLGNRHLFPNKHIVTSSEFPDRHWELTDIRKQIWAAHILQDKATLDSPPKSAHFSEEQRIRAPLALPASAAVPTPTVVLPDAPTALPSGATSATDLILLMLAQQMTPQNRPPNEPTTGPALPATPAPPNPAAPASPAVHLPRQFRLQEFCLCYHIPPGDEPKLAELEWLSGDRNIDKLVESDWKEAGFKHLGWLRDLDAHKKFLSEIRNGKFL
ncbi:hypothetical protein C8J57DRAFT_1514052 [Mycena rebaudengoi]|nr:hypothetical protein C8J57DRAFT_1514052 [Mycena rebaudengoi]